MADNDTAGKGGNGTADTSKNNGDTQSQTNNNDSQGDWKAKYEAEVEAHAKTQKKLTDANTLFKRTEEDLKSKLEKAEQDKASVETEIAGLKDAQTQAEKRQAAQNKQAELLQNKSDKTKELVKKLGLELTDAEDEDAIKAFTDKVDAVEGTAGDGTSKDTNTPSKPPEPPVNSNNTRTETANTNKSQDQEMAELESRVADIKF